jgi:hypothetical protein
MVNKEEQASLALKQVSGIINARAGAARIGQDAYWEWGNGDMWLDIAETVGGIASAAGGILLTPTTYGASTVTMLPVGYSAAVEGANNLAYTRGYDDITKKIVEVYSKDTTQNFDDLVDKFAGSNEQLADVLKATDNKKELINLAKELAENN